MPGKRGKRVYAPFRVLGHKCPILVPSTSFVGVLPAEGLTFKSRPSVVAMSSSSIHLPAQCLGTRAHHLLKARAVWIASVGGNKRQ